MSQSLPSSAVSRHRVLPENSAGQAKANLRSPDVQALREVWREHVGTVVTRARQLLGKSLKEFAALVDRDERQVARWESGAERPQFDALFAVPDIRRPLVIAIAELAGAAVDVETVVRIRRQG